jgi:hypothetical protein
VTKADISGALPWLVAAIAVFVTHLLSESRERRKELRFQLDKLIERLLALEERGMQFHISEKFNEAEARWIETEISSLERLLQRLLGRFPQTLAEALTFHKRAFTLSNFTKDVHKQQAPGAALVVALTDATVEYEEQIEAVYVEMYPRSFPYFRVGNRGITEVAGVLTAFWVGLLIAGVGVYLLML